ncbi:hypothetical protein Tco_1227356 [Tanacetum coccineum]
MGNHLPPPPLPFPATNVPSWQSYTSQGGNLKGLSAEEAWKTIEDCAQYDKQWQNPTSTISDQTITNLKDHLVGNEVVRVKIPKCMSWLDAYDKPIGDLDMMEDKAKIETENVNNVKFSCMFGQFNKEQAYLDLESPINIMSRFHYNWIMSNRLEPRRKPSNPKKNCNFVGRVKGLGVFVGNFTYECNFMVLEDTTSVIDHYLGSVVFEKPFMEAIELVYNKKEGTVMFERDKERIIFKMPQKMDMFKHVDFTDRGTDSIPPFVIESDDGNYEKTYYLDILDLGPECKYDEYVCRGIRSLMAAKARRKNKREVT